MGKQLVVRTITLISLLLSVFLVGWPVTAFAHTQPVGAPATLAGRPAGLTNDYKYILQLQNMITGRCLKDDFPIDTARCADADSERWAFTYEKTDADGHEIGTLQNLSTGSCLDDSVSGLRAYFCHLPGDPGRIFQLFKLTDFPGDGAYQLQNMATGSCVDDSDRYGLRGWYCNSTYFQKWARL